MFIGVSLLLLDPFPGTAPIGLSECISPLYRGPGIVHETDRIRILFLGASPKDRVRVRVDEEVRRVKERLSRGRLQACFELIYEPAVRTSDLSSHLMKHMPHIVHISEHGEGNEETGAQILLEDENGAAKSVPVSALAELFAELKDSIRCVVLGACHSKAQARAVGKYIDYVVGIGGGVLDPVALTFAERFYGTLAQGKSVEKTFKIARIDLNVEGLEHNEAFVLFARDVMKPSAVFSSQGAGRLEWAKRRVAAQIVTGVLAIAGVLIGTALLARSISVNKTSIDKGNPELREDDEVNLTPDASVAVIGPIPKQKPSGHDNLRRPIRGPRQPRGVKREQHGPPTDDDPDPTATDSRTRIETESQEVCAADIWIPFLMTDGTILVDGAPARIKESTLLSKTVLVDRTDSFHTVQIARDGRIVCETQTDLCSQQRVTLCP